MMAENNERHVSSTNTKGSIVNNIVPFDFEGSLIRTMTIDGDPWIVLADVCRVLEIGNPAQAATRLDEDEKGIITTDTLGGPQQTITINESGLYSLILTSRKEAAKRFKKWVTAEVLPSIRKTGSYAVPASSVELSKMDRNVIGGIVKAITTKAMAAIDDRVVAVDEKLAKLMAEVRATLDGFDPTQHRIVGYRRMIDVLVEEGVPAKGRRAMSSRCSGMMRRWSVATERDKATRISAETGRYVFQIDAVRDWLEAEGRALIVAHKARIAGQGVLALVSKPKPRAIATQTTGAST